VSLPTEAQRALVSQAVGRELIQRVAPLLAAAGIPVMPLKGVWLQTCVYPASESRVTTDVDLLVPEDRYAHALAVLTAAGWRKRLGNVSEVALDHPELPLPLDLHRRLFTRGAFGLHTSDMFERGRIDRGAFGVGVTLPDPKDAFAHLVGHFVKSRTAFDDRMRLRDFVAVVERFELDPSACARRLEDAGMARAARYVLSGMAGHGGQPFAREVIQALPPDRVGERIVSLARALAHQSRWSPRVAALPGFLVDRSLAAGALAFMLRVVDRGREIQD
jgi:hypothetical protein